MPEFQKSLRKEIWEFLSNNEIAYNYYLFGSRNFHVKLKDFEF